MKTIGQACLEASGNAPCGIPNYEGDDYNAGFLKGTVYGFEAGVEFAQQWIDVNDEFPNPEDGSVLVKLSDGRVTTSFILTSGDFAYNVHPTHWRPIELKQLTINH